MTALLTEIVTLLGGGIVEFSTQLGAGIQSLVTELFIATAEGGATALSVFGGLVVIFAAVALTINLSVRLFSWLSSMGSN